jgi:hypothetical protein
MHTIIKIVDVNPDAIPLLHNALKQPGMCTPEGYLPPDESSSPDSKGTIPFATIMESKLHPQSGKYTVTIWFNLTIEHRDKSLFYPPLSALEEVFKAIDIRLLPDAKAVELEKARAAAEDALAERISTEILDKTCWYDITNDTGEIIVATNRRITRSHITKIAGKIEILGEIE